MAEVAPPESPVVRKTITCFLCGGIHIYPGPRFENHLINEHGAVFDVDFLIKISLFKKEHGKLPDLNGNSVVPANDKPKPETKDASTGEELHIQCVETQTDITEETPTKEPIEKETIETQTDILEEAPKEDIEKQTVETQTDILEEYTVAPIEEQEHEPDNLENGTTAFEEEDMDITDRDEQPSSDSGFNANMVLNIKQEAFSQDFAVSQIDQEHFDAIGNEGDNNMDMEEEQNYEEEAPSSDNVVRIQTWHCPLCPRVFKRHNLFKQHVSIAHELEMSDILAIESVMMTEEEFQHLKAQEDHQSHGQQAIQSQSQVPDCDKPREVQGESFLTDKTKRKPIGKKWATNSFSSTFTCYFCHEQFRKDYKLKLHLMLNHKHEDPEEMAKAKEELMKSKLDGCVHKCALCGSKYNSVANFTRHIKDSHGVSRAQYRKDYGSSEIVSRTFKCELCDKEIKHTRNIIGAHMKMVHLISWREYQEILMKMRAGEVIDDLPTAEMFDCIICGVSVKYKREHLNKKHQITEDVYDQLIAKKNRGEDISNAIPERESTKCIICDRECLDFKKHIERSHNITEEQYAEIAAQKGIEIPSFNTKPIVLNNSTPPAKQSPVPPKSKSKLSLEVPHRGSPTISQHAPSNGTTLSTDLQCYFGCDEPFKKDYQLFLHLKLKHRNEPPEEIAKAYEAAEEEIELTKRSGSVFVCALCDKTFNDNGAFYSHISTKHNMKWNDYKDQYGRCEVESKPFECKICSKVIKYDRNTIHTHLKNVHGINWAFYLDRIRKMRRGEVPDELPQIEMVECRVCNIQVKYLKEHLRNAHKITEQEYRSLFEGDGSGDKIVTVKPPTPVTANPLPLPEELLPPPPPLMAAPLPKPQKSDITDKTNKTCSSCTITFDSRRSFIEHCTTVHNMKFKTKSGITISAPTLQQAAMKRKAPESPANQIHISHQPEAKRQKTIQTEEGNFSIEYDNGAQDEGMIAHSTSNNDQSLAEAPQYTPTGVSKWNQCVYQCCFCSRTTMSRSSMTSHIHHSHGVPIKEYKEKNYPDIEVVTRWFQCRLCSARTKFVKDCIAPHLKMTHNMDIELYERTYMQPEDWPELIPEGTLTLKGDKGLLNAAQQGQMTFAQVKEEIATNNATVAPAVYASPMPHRNDKWNKCQFQCALCDFTNMDSRQMRSHIATKHGMSHDAYVQQYGSTEIVTKKFQCQLCLSSMKHCRQNIYAHMKDVHKITLDEYEERIGGYNGPDGDQQFAVTPQRPAAPQRPVQQYDTSALLDNGNKPNRWNKCRFQCAMCKKLSSEKRHIREHIIKHHEMPMADYEALYGDCEVHTEYFFCGVCHAEVKHNLKNISLHLQNVHKMSPADYEAQFGRMHDGSTTGQDLVNNHFTESNNEADNSNQDPEAIPPITVPAPMDFMGGSGKKSRMKRGTGHFPCEYCGKVFSNISNRNRHTMLSCEIKRNGGEKMELQQGFVGEMADEEDEEGQLHIDIEGVEETSQPALEMEEPPIMEEEPPSVEEDYKVKTIDHKCPYPDCEEVFPRSFLLKRHLEDAHQIQNLTVKLPSLAEEKKKLLNSSKTEVVDERKVPPLKVKLNSPDSSPVTPSQPKPAAKTNTPKIPQPCQYCPYKNANLYILGRHQRACLKRKQQMEALLAQKDIKKEQEEYVESGGQEMAEENNESKSENEQKLVEDNRESQAENEVIDDESQAEEVSENDEQEIQVHEEESHPQEEDDGIVTGEAEDANEEIVVDPNVTEEHNDLDYETTEEEIREEINRQFEEEQADEMEADSEDQPVLEINTETVEEEEEVETPIEVEEDEVREESEIVDSEPPSSDPVPESTSSDKPLSFEGSGNQLDQE